MAKPNYAVAIPAALALHGLGHFVAAMLQGFTIPVAKNSRLALTAHVKTITHGLLLMGVGTVYPHLTLGPTASKVACYMLVGGGWASYVADTVGSFTGVHLPIAARTAGATCDPAEDDYSVPKEKRHKQSQGLFNTVMIKLSAVSMAVGGMIMASGAPLAKLLP